MFSIPLPVVGGLMIDPSVGRKLKSLPEEQRSLRVAVLGGGCSGFQYEIALGKPEEEDDVLSLEGYEICVDPVSQPFLAGACLKYAEDLTGSRFVIDNPNASSSCGCGLSFSI